MKILNTSQFNEKLDIQPMSKERLDNIFIPKSAEDMRADFKTGDIVTLSTNGGVDGVFVSKNDLTEYKYNELLNMSINDMMKYGKLEDGVFITKYLGTLGFGIVDYFDKDLVRLKTVCVEKVYRPSEISQPLKPMYFKNPPKERCKLIYDKERQRL
jgi:hypothetical protein